ncbi:dynamin family protein [Campylobacter helveticus]|uniref:dynamin family protein n=1 Tax=Campylobacter helveticus TaxID=28898 RepID=UPI0009C370C3|nr:dynamin family protein [Campylobacter helveticus]ARE80355.1 GTP-binding protein (dynamin domain) [Campylobacter helveticus]MCR2055319.1 dynamin family protein [Campylobacter helveticus]MCR2066666.1 dynamin family protein [Campylobacter helveticus]TXK54313.1 ATP-binding protein [Campylobacter helveticus]SMC22677.1 Dynamin family protein [Campylobacter helveticus]
MQILFQRLWQNRLQFLDFNSNFSNSSNLDISEFAIILSVDETNYDRYFLLKEFANIMKKIALRVDIFSIQYAQICTLNLLRRGFLNKRDLLKALKILESITNNDLIIEFVESVNLEELDKKTFFNTTFGKLDSINLKLQTLALNETNRQNLQKALEKFQNLDFNVAITGVMNAGKSSLLNALLKEEFLGVSNIPETANLSVLRYGESKKAKVYFWSEKEWQNILLNSKFSVELESFVNGLSKKYHIDEYIQKDGLIKEISQEELKEFSSAKNQISAFIKKIELEANLEFLQNNISIVDTPGLDDVVVQRELLTREYIKQSDFLIHLMNASQSLTQKDMEFLVECLLNSRLGKFLVVLTKADLLNQEDLKEVINYTKASLKAGLEGKEMLVEKIDFLCVSAKKANDFYKHLVSEEEFKQSGMKEFEAYLFDALYSGEKSKTALNAYRKELGLELMQILSDYEAQNTLFKENSYATQDENAKFLLEFKKQEEELLNAKEDIKNSIFKLENSQNDIASLVLLLAKKLKERLVDELKYLKVKAQKPDLNRILSMVDITARDGINDILREVKFENLKKIDELKTNLSLKYSFLQEEFDSGFEDFKDKISKAIEDIFTADKFALLKLELSQIIQEKNDIFTMEKRLDEAVVKGFEGFELDKVLENLEINMSFFNFLNEKLVHFEKSVKEKLKNLTHLLKNLEKEQFDFTQNYEENLKKITQLKELQKELLNAN